MVAGDGAPSPTVPLGHARVISRGGREKNGDAAPFVVSERHPRPRRQLTGVELSPIVPIPLPRREPRARPALLHQQTDPLPRVIAQEIPVIGEWRVCWRALQPLRPIPFPGLRSPSRLRGEQDSQTAPRVEGHGVPIGRWWTAGWKPLCPSRAVPFPGVGERDVADASPAEQHRAPAPTVVSHARQTSRLWTSCGRQHAPVVAVPFPGLVEKAIGRAGG
jgi:hypothetical protein